METNNKNENMVHLANKADAALQKTELIAACIALLGVGLKLSALPFGSIALVLSLSTLSMLYFLTVFSLTEDVHANHKDRFIVKLNGMGCSIGVIGILFLVQNWPGSKLMVLMGSVVLLASALFMVKAKTSKPELILFNYRMILRAVVIAVIGLSLYLLSKEKLTEHNIHHNAASADTIKLNDSTLE